MPRPSRFMIRFALCYLMLGITFGSLMLIHKAVDLHPMIWSLIPIHVEILFWGFIIQFTLGTAYWILPRYLEGSGRGNRRMPWLMIGLLNCGIFLYLSGTATAVGSLLLVAGRSLELMSVGLFIFLHWNRITSYRNI